MMIIGFYDHFPLGDQIKIPLNVPSSPYLIICYACMSEPRLDPASPIPNQLLRGQEELHSQQPLHLM